MLADGKIVARCEPRRVDLPMPSVTAMYRTNKANEVAEDKAGAHNTHSAIASSLARTAPGGGNGSPKVHTERTSIISASLKPMQSSHTIA